MEDAGDWINAYKKVGMNDKEITTKLQGMGIPNETINQAFDNFASKGITKDDPIQSEANDEAVDILFDEPDMSFNKFHDKLDDSMMGEIPEEVAQKAYDQAVPVHPDDVGVGDHIDFGDFGELYVLDTDAGLGDKRKFWVTDQEDDRFKKDASGWFIDPIEAKKIIQTGEDADEDEEANEDFETPSMDDVGSYDFDNGNVMDMSKIPMEFLHFPEETPEKFLKGREQDGNGMPMNGEPEPDPMPEQPISQRIFVTDRCPPGEHFCEQEGECVPEGKKKANQQERVHHVANSTMNHKPKEVGPITMMDTDPNEMPRQNMGWPQDTTQTSGVFGPLHPTLSPLEPSSSNRPCDPGFVLNPVTGHCDPTNLINLQTQEKINYPDYIQKTEEGCGCNNTLERAIETIGE